MYVRTIERMDARKGRDARRNKKKKKKKTLRVKE